VKLAVNWRCTPALHWWKYDLSPAGLIARMRTRRRSSCVGSRKLAGNPLRRKNNGAPPETLSELLIRYGGFSES
jgi:hypothetical protein